MCARYFRCFVGGLWFIGFVCAGCWVLIWCCIALLPGIYCLLVCLLGYVSVCRFVGLCALGCSCVGWLVGWFAFGVG